MSDVVSVTKTEESASVFTEKEQKLIVAAIGSLKGGQTLEIDMDTFVKLGGFNTKKTAQNQWGTLKKKLIPAPVSDGEGGVKTPSPPTPKAKTPAKKRSKKESGGEEAADGEAADEGTPAKKVKTPKKTSAKKGKKTTSDDGAEEEPAAGDGSPKTKPAKPRAKKAAAAVKQVTEDAADEDTAADTTFKAENDDVPVNSEEATPRVTSSDQTKMEGAAE